MRLTPAFKCGCHIETLYVAIVSMLSKLHLVDYKK